MGRFLKALVMTLLIMEITAIVALTTVWTGLSELHAPQTLVMSALALTSMGLCLLSAMVFRRALRAEHRLEGEVAEDIAVSAPPPAAHLPVNATGPAQARSQMPPAAASLPRHVR
jgi:hypothetical protein